MHSKQLSKASRISVPGEATNKYWLVCELFEKWVSVKFNRIICSYLNTVNYSIELYFNHEELLRSISLITTVLYNLFFLPTIQTN